jgi:hypothetical protein
MDINQYSTHVYPQVRGGGAFFAEVVGSLCPKKG